MRSGNKPWMLDLRYLGGRREFYETEALAERRREEVLDEVKVQGTQALSIGYEERIEFIRAKHRLQKFGVQIGDAVAFYERHHAVAEPILFSEAILRVEGVKKSSKKDSEYVRKFKSTITSLKDAVGDKLLSAVTRDEIEAWLFRSDWKPDTIKNKRTDVRTFFNYAAKRHWITLNPAESIEAVAGTNKPPGILTPEECASVLQAAKTHLPYLLPYIVLNMLCGIRAEEVVKLVPDNIQVDAGFVEVPAYRGDEAIAKSRKRRIVDLSDNAKAWLTGAEKIKPKTPKWYARQFPKLRKAAKLNHWPKNCLRHSFASYHLAMHGSADKTAVQMGHHSTKMLFEHYRELVRRCDAERFWSILPK